MSSPGVTFSLSHSKALFLMKPKSWKSGHLREEQEDVSLTPRIQLAKERTSSKLPKTIL